MREFAAAGDLYSSDPQLQQRLLQSLAHGGPAAARFPSDLEALIAAARTTPAITAASPTSRQAADVLLLVASTNLANGGCASTGGSITTSLPTITWKHTVLAEGYTTDGSLKWPDGGQVDFIAKLVNGTWNVEILAC